FGVENRLWCELTLRSQVKPPTIIVVTCRIVGPTDISAKAAKGAARETRPTRLPDLTTGMAWVYRVSYVPCACTVRPRRHAVGCTACRLQRRWEEGPGR